MEPQQETVKIKTESNLRCGHCQANKENINLRQQIQNLNQKLDEKNKEL